MKKHLTTLLLIFLLIPLTEGQETSVLFIGNSLTYTNDLPGMLERLGKAYDLKIKTTAICKPNYALEDHWHDGKVQDEIAGGNYDLVIFQQGPSSQPPGRTMLIRDGGKISDLCRKHGAQPAYFMVWPALGYYHTFEGVIENHRVAADRNEALLLPVGAVWKAYREQYAEAGLYGPDGFHPSGKGSLLTALSIFHSLFPDRELEKLPFSKFRKWVNEEAAFEEMITFVGGWADARY